MRRNGVVPAQVAATGRPDANYLWPISRALNPNFKGVIYVDGAAGVSGRARGKVTVVTTGNLILLDDLTYVTAPNTICADILGLLTPMEVVIADNNMNSPFKVNNVYQSGYSDTPDETFHASILTLRSFVGENPSSGTSNTEPRQGTVWGRGCDVIIGGLVESQAGATGSTGGQGWNDMRSFDVCMLRTPPPYSRRPGGSSRIGGTRSTRWGSTSRRGSRKTSER